MSNLNLLIPSEAGRKNKDRRNRLQSLIQWALEQGYTLETLNFERYRDYLVQEQGLAANTVKAHITTIRGYVTSIIEDGSLGRALYAATNQSLTAEERKSLVDSVLGHLALTLHADNLRVKVPQNQPRNLNLSDETINDLFNTLKMFTLVNIRDAAVITIMAVTGLRESELCALDVTNLRHHADGDHLALHVPAGQGCNERLIPYLDDEWVLEVVDVWLRLAHIQIGPVFRGFYKSGNLIRPTRFAPSSVERLLVNYPVRRGDDLVTLKPLNLRHAYAGHLHRKGVDLDTLKRYLGVNSVQTVWDYLGITRDWSYHSYKFDLSRLPNETD